MLILRVLKYARNGVREYFENTTVHGFRYILFSKAYACKLFWIFSILATVSLCFFLIGKSLQEASENPIMTNTEEILVENLPMPTISISAPKELDADEYFRSLLNFVDAWLIIQQFTTSSILDTRIINELKTFCSLMQIYFN